MADKVKRMPAFAVKQNRTQAPETIMSRLRAQARSALFEVDDNDLGSFLGRYDIDRSPQQLQSAVESRRKVFNWSPTLPREIERGIGMPALEAQYEFIFQRDSRLKGVFDRFPKFNELREIPPFDLMLHEIADGNADFAENVMDASKAELPEERLNEIDGFRRVEAMLHDPDGASRLVRQGY